MDLTPTAAQVALHGEPGGCVGCGRDVAGKGDPHTAECRLARYDDALEHGHAWSTVDTEAVTEDEIASGTVDPECDRCGLSLSDMDLDTACEPRIAVPASALRAVRDTWERGDLAGAVTDLLAFLDEHEMRDTPDKMTAKESATTSRLTDQLTAPANLQVEAAKSTVDAAQELRDRHTCDLCEQDKPCSRYDILVDQLAKACAALERLGIDSFDYLAHGHRQCVTVEEKSQ